MIFAISYGNKLVMMLFPRNNKEIKVNQNTEQKMFSEPFEADSLMPGLPGLPGFIFITNKKLSHINVCNCAGIV